MSIEKSKNPTKGDFLENEWTKYAIEHGIQVHITPIVHRRPRLGPGLGKGPTMDARLLQGLILISKLRNRN